MPTVNIFCDPSAGVSSQSVRNDPVSTFDSGVITGLCSAILGGIPAAVPFNNNHADLSVIVMGQTNNINVPPGIPAANGCFNFIGNGFNQLVSGFNNFIGGGSTNQVNTFVVGANTFGAAIVAGENNIICDDGISAAGTGFIGAGSGNIVGGLQSSIVGGDSNAAMGSRSFIGGGELNCIKPGQSTSSISGGCQNTIGGSAPGALLASFSFIGAGSRNCINTTALLPSTWDTIGGGLQNQICSSEFASIFGGNRNTVSGNASFIGGGDTNVINSNHGLVNCAVIAGGLENVICDNGVTPANFGFIGGGSTNNVFGVGAVVVGGMTNNACGQFSFVGGGGCSVSLSTAGNNAIGDLSAIGGGTGNIAFAEGSAIAGGGANEACGLYSFIGGGQGNLICNDSRWSVIGGGEGNLISTFTGVSAKSFIGGGSTNYLYGCFGAIAGGCQNISCSILTSQVGGYLNLIELNSNLSVISGGSANRIFESTYSFIGSGLCNAIGGLVTGFNASTFGIIAGGFRNLIDASIAAGTNYGIIGGGLQNKICAGTNHASIFSGFNNCVAGSCSSILGGSGNTDNGWPNTGMYGTALSAANIPGGFGAFWANELVVPNIPAGVGGLPPAGYPPGSLYWLPAGLLKQVYVV